MLNELVNTEFDVIEIFQDESESYSKVLVFLHGLRGSGQYHEDLLMNKGWYGESIEDLKVVFPTTPFKTNPDYSLWWVNNYWIDGDFDGLSDRAKPKDPNCPVSDGEGDFWMCAWDLRTLDISGKLIKGLIENEMNLNGISSQNIYLGGFSQGG